MIACIDFEVPCIVQLNFKISQQFIKSLNVDFPFFKSLFAFANPLKILAPLKFT